MARERRRHLHRPGWGRADRPGGLHPSSQGPCPRLRRRHLGQCRGRRGLDALDGGPCRSGRNADPQPPVELCPRAVPVDRARRLARRWRRSARGRTDTRGRPHPGHRPQRADEREGHGNAAPGLRGRSAAPVPAGRRRDRARSRTPRRAGRRALPHPRPVPPGERRKSRT